VDWKGILIGAAAVVTGIDQIKKATRKAEESGDLGRAKSPPRLKNPKALPVPSNMKLTVATVHTLNQRVKYIKQLVVKGRNDPRIRALAVKIVSKKCGKKFCIGERDYQKEVTAIFDWMRKNVRYVRDNIDRDTFQHPVRTIQFGGGDCFPQGTLLLTRDGFVPVERLQVGDEIHDGERWVQVMNTWDRGPKQIVAATLNNGCVLRLSENHRVLRVPRRRGGTHGTADLPGFYEDAEEVRMHELRIGDDLLQPRSFAAGGEEELDEDEAFLIGAYLAEGCRMRNQVSIAGVPNGKGIRERTIEILKRRGIRFREMEREIRFRVDDWPRCEDLGRVATEKHLPHFRWGPRTVATILAAMEQGDGGMSTSGVNMVFSTVSVEQAISYRVLNRMMGRSTGWRTLIEHGGFGKNPIHRLTVRSEHRRRPWAKVKRLELEDERVHSFDFATESGKVYLPESDTVVLQCDDYTITMGALLQSIGYPIKLRVIQTTDADDWNHIYLAVGIPPGHPQAWMPLDASVDRPAGWEPPRSMIKRLKDYEVPV